MQATRTRDDDPWLAGAIAAKLRSLAGQRMATMNAADVGVFDYRDVETADLRTLDARHAAEAARVSHEDPRLLAGLAAMAALMEEPTWFEYDPGDRLAYHHSLGEVANGERGPMPERIGVMVSRDGQGRLGIEHAFVRDGEIEFSPWRANFNATARVPDDEVVMEMPATYGQGRLTPEQVEAKRMFVERVTFTLNTYGRDLVRRVRENRPDLEETLVSESLCDAEDEATYALGVIATMTPSNGRAATTRDDAPRAVTMN